MQTQNNQSEVARIRDAINAEYQASHFGLLGLRETAKHKFITTCQVNIAKHILALCEFADETAMLEVFDQLGD
jgi:hypothetical protein